MPASDQPSEMDTTVPDDAVKTDTTGVSVPDQTDSTAVKEHAVETEPSGGLAPDQRDSLAEPISEAESDTTVAHSSETEQPGILLPEERDSVNAKTEIPRPVLPEMKLPMEADSDSLRK